MLTKQERFHKNMENILLEIYNFSFIKIVTFPQKCTTYYFICLIIIAKYFFLNTTY